MSDILNMIDNAIDGYETSADAMRWIPDPPKRSLVVVAEPPTPEQIQAAWVAVTRAFEPLAAQLRAIGEAMKDAVIRLRFVLPVESQRDPRLCRMRQAYRRRHR